MNAGFETRDIGKGRWRAAPFKAWVSKTDITQFLRCKYRVFVAHKYNKSFEEFVDSRIIRFLIEQGSRFERSIVSQMPFEEVESIETVLDQSVILRSPQLIQNNELGIRGIVDLIATERGALCPIEVKFHKTVQKSDRLELAFYWKLLEPLRKGEPRPKGYVLLNTGKAVEVELKRSHFATVERIIADIRLVKEIGTEPAISSECSYCDLREECLSLVWEKRGLSMIHGIAGTRQEELSTLGIKDIRALARADTGELHRAWRQLTQYAPGRDEIGGMQMHARSWEQTRPIYFGSVGVPVGNELLVLDLEYDNFVCVWLVGLLASDTQATECYQFFADETIQEKQILLKLIEMLEKYPTYQILTWDGLRADIPQLEAAWHRQGLPHEELQDLKQRHLDLYQFFRRNYRFPLWSFGLKEIDKYLGFVRKYEDMNGLEAQYLYHQYLSIPKRNSQERLSIKQKLLEYNKEDLDATLYVLGQLQSLAHDGEAT